MSPRNAELCISAFIAIVGIACLAGGLTLCVGSVIWFILEFKNVPDLVMDRVARICLSLSLMAIGHFALARAAKVWREVP